MKAESTGFLLKTKFAFKYRETGTLLTVWKLCDGLERRNAGASGSAGGHLLPHAIPPVSVLCALLFRSCPVTLISLCPPVLCQWQLRFTGGSQLCHLSLPGNVRLSGCVRILGSMQRELSHGCARCFAKAGKRQPLPWGSYVLQALITMGIQYTKNI